MIDIEKIRKAYHRFSGFSDEFTYTVVKAEHKSKNMEGKDVIEYRWELRRSGRVILTSTEEECTRVKDKLNEAWAEFMQDEYDLMMNAMKEADK